MKFFHFKISKNGLHFDEFQRGESVLYRQWIIRNYSPSPNNPDQFELLKTSPVTFHIVLIFHRKI